MTVEPQIVTIGGVILLLCVGGVILSIVLPLLSSILAVFGTVLELLFDVLTGGPIAWCGCLVVFILVGGCCLLVSVLSFSLSSCGTPDAVNLCSWFGM